MTMTERRQIQPRTRRLLTVILTVMLICGVSALVWLLWIKPALDKKRINSFEACVSGGNPVLDSYPAVCVTKDGRHFDGPGPNLKGSPTIDGTGIR